MTTRAIDLANWLTLRAWVEPGELPAGGHGTLLTEVELPAGCHIEAHEPSEPFLAPTTLAVDEVEGVTFGSISYPPAEEQRFDWSPVVLRVYRGVVRLTAAVEVAANAAPGPREIHCRLRYQGCTPTNCLMPNSQPADASFIITAASG